MSFNSFTHILKDFIHQSLIIDISLWSRAFIITNDFILSIFCLYFQFEFFNFSISALKNLYLILSWKFILNLNLIDWCFIFILILKIIFIIYRNIVACCTFLRSYCGSVINGRESFSIFLNCFSIYHLLLRLIEITPNIVSWQYILAFIIIKFLIWGSMCKFSWYLTWNTRISFKSF
jgi:hypothetical protein